MVDWYLWDGEKQRGPIDRSELDNRIQFHPNPSHVRLWREGFSDWKSIQEAFDVSGKSTLDPTTFSGPSESPRRSSYQNFFAKNWRGEYPLWVSYWVIGILCNIAAVAVPILIGVLLPKNAGSSPIGILAFYSLTWLTLVAISIWQLVSIWRSAQVRIVARAALGKRAPWAGLAKIAVVIGFVQLFGLIVRTAVPQLSEVTSIAFMDDPDIPPYAIRVMNGGAEAEITGGIKFGLSNDFEKILNASTEVHVVHLDSIGGRIGEGEKLNALIRNKNLDTYVDDKCLSACTLAFAGGRQRILKRGATLGFHRGAFGGEDQVDDHTSGIERTIYGNAGFSSAFIDRALATKNREMWKPTEQELLASGVITRVSSGDEFAVSGLGGNKFTRDDWDKTLLKSAGVYRALKDKYPQFYSEVLDVFVNEFAHGTTQAQLVEKSRVKLNGFIKTLLPLADDLVLIDFDQLIVAQYQALQRKDATACYKFATGVSIDSTIIDMLPSDLTEREQKLDERIISSARTRGSQPKMEASWTKICTNIAQKGFSNVDLELLSSNAVPASAYSRYCSVVIAFYQQISELPPMEAAAVLRDMFAPG